jgi:hypothetical protein
MEAAACAKLATGYTYARREPEKTALFQVLQQHLLTFARQSPVRPQKLGQARCDDAIRANLLRSGMVVLRRSNNPSK